MKSFTIDGNNFSNLDGFYDEIQKVLCPGFEMGRNLDALNDVFVGGLSDEGIDFKEPATVNWTESSKSEKELGSEQFEQITKIIKEQGHQLTLS